MAGTALIGNLAVNLTLLTAAFEKGADLAEKRMRGFGKTFSSWGKGLAQSGTIATAAITAPLVAFGKGAFDVATDAAELQSAFDQTFGRLAADMNAWAEATGNAMGRSTREIQAGANAFGLYFNQAAKTRMEAAALSKQFTVLAQDLSSFHNTSVSEAQDALRSGLSGETEPLRRYGVFLNEAAVAAKAAELGLTGVNGKLTDQEKILARAALIMEQTKNAQGDVARTADSTANQLRAANAAWEELQIVIGTKLLPVLTPLIAQFAELVNRFAALDPSLQTAIVGIGATLAVLGPLAVGIGGVVSAVGALLPLFAKLGGLLALLKTGFAIARIAALAMLPALAPFLVPLGAIAAAIAAVYLAWKNWDRIAPILQRLYGAVKTWLIGKLGPIFDWVKSALEVVGDAFGRLYERVVGNSYVPDMVDGIGAEMGRLDTTLVRPVEAATAQAGAAFEAMSDRVRSLMDELFPERSALARFQADAAAIEKDSSLFSADRAEALRRLRARHVDEQIGARGDIVVVGERPLVDDQKVEESLDAFAEAMRRKLIEPTRLGTTEVIEQFNQMAQGVVGALDGLVRSIKRGDVVGIIGGVLNTLGTIAGAVGGFKVGPLSFPGQGSGAGDMGGFGGPMSFGRLGAAGGTAQRPYFDLRGAVMTADLIGQMNAIGDTSATRGASMALQAISTQRRTALGLG